LPRSRTREQGDARPPDALLFCPRGCPRGRKVRRNAKAHSSSEGRFRVGRCLREKKRKRPSTFSTALGKPGFLESRARVPRARFVFGGRIGLAKKAVPINRGRSIEKRRSRIPNSWRVPTSGKRFAVDLQRSKILSTRLLFRARPKRERIGRRPAGVQNTRALTDARLRRRTSRARTRSARLRPRSDPSARRRNQTPADRRPSQRPRRRSFFTGTHP